MLTIYTDNSISLDGTITAFKVAQHRDKTQLYDIHGNTYALPRTRYSLAAEKPNNGIPGRLDFERDFRAIYEEHDK